MITTKAEANHLQERVEELKQNYEKVNKLITEKLNEIISSLAAPFKIRPFKGEVELQCPYREEYKEDRYAYDYVSIEYCTDDPNSKSDYDFGSSFNIRVSNKHIYVNVGTCGEYGSKDKYQVARVCLLAKLFEHEEEIVNSLVHIVEETNLEDELKEHRNIDSQLYTYNETIKKQKLQEEKEQFNKLLENSIGKIYVFISEYNYCNDWVVKGIESKCRYTSGFGFKITKVTPKRVYYKEIDLANGEKEMPCYGSSFEDKNYLFANNAAGQFKIIDGIKSLSRVIR